MKRIIIIAGPAARVSRNFYRSHAPAWERSL